MYQQRARGLNSSQKEDRHMVIDASGGAKLKDKEAKLEADVSTDLMVRMALMRRGDSSRS